MKQLYFFLVLILCSAGNSLFAQTYCPVSFPGGVSAITEVRFETMTNVSATSSTSDYEDFTGIADTVYMGQNVTLFVNGSTGGAFTDSVTAYFDWNQDGDFLDTLETYTVGALTNSTGLSIGSALVKNIKIGNMSGNVRVRILKKRNGGNSSCNNSGTGQAEDYNIFVSPVWMPCSGYPLAGQAVGPSNICAATPFELVTTNFTVGADLIIYWEEETGPGIWTLIPNATTTILIEQGINAPAQYRAVAYCPNSPASGLSNVVSVTTPSTNIVANNPVCIGDTINVNATPCSTCTLAITGPNNFTQTQSFIIPNASLANKGWYYTSTTDNSCSTVNNDSFYVNVVNCADSVWPGDANNDLITNYVDALYIALYNGYNGFSRPNASIVYTGQYCPDWAFTGANNLNLKHIDCNGDGIINLNDTMAVHQNYNQQHLKKVFTPKEKVSSLPDLYFDTTGIQFLPNTTVMIPVKLGTQAYPMNDIMGIGAEIKIFGMPMTMPMSIDHSFQTWIGYNNTLNFKQTVNNYQIDFAHCRKNHSPVSGLGTIGHLFLNIPASAAGDTVTLYFDDVVIIDSAGNVLTNYNVLPATFIIKDPSGIKGMQSAINEAAIIPNPSTTQAELLLQLNENTKLLVTVTDVAGRKIWEKDLQLAQGAHRLDLPRALAPGVYQVVIHGQSTGKLKTLKWVKQ